MEFASRVKTEIARQGGLVDLIWYVFSMRCFTTRKLVATITDLFWNTNWAGGRVKLFFFHAIWAKKERILRRGHATELWRNNAFVVMLVYVWEFWTPWVKSGYFKTQCFAAQSTAAIDRFHWINKFTPLFVFFSVFRDGQLKRTSVKPEFKQQRQEDYASTLKID